MTTLSPQAQERLRRIEEVISDKTDVSNSYFQWILLDDWRDSEFAIYKAGEIISGNKKEYLETVSRNTLNFRPLGTPPDLCRVLEWLEKNELLFEERNFYGFMRKTGEWFVAAWDFSRPLLRDQSEDLINFLFDILPIEK